MTEKPEDYAPPKHRAAIAESLRAVGDAADEAMRAQNELPPETRNVSDYAALGNQAIQRYFDAAAKHMESAGDEILKQAQAARDDLYMQAEDVRHTARALTAAVEAAASRTKQAALGVTDLRKAYADDVNRERKEAEAARVRAAS